MNFFKKIAIAAAACVTLGTAAFGQNNVIRLNVPFKFHAGGTVYQPGTYEVRTNPNGSPAVLSGIEQRNTGFLAVKTKTTSKADQPGKLVFHRYGNAYYLYRVEPGRGLDGVELYATPSEREMAKAVEAEDFVLSAGTN